MSDISHHYWQCDQRGEAKSNVRESESSVSTFPIDINLRDSGTRNRNSPKHNLFLIFLNILFTFFK
jgi:hypothetical protein